MVDNNYIQEMQKILYTLKNSGWKLLKDSDLNDVSGSQGVICMEFTKGHLALSVKCGENDYV